MGAMNLPTNRIVGFLLAGFVLFFPMYSIAGKATIFPSVEAMIEKFADYSASNGTFKILKKEPLHIQLSLKAIKGDDPELIEDDVRVTLVDGIYRAFVHTSINQITITAIPLEIEIGSKKTRYLPGFKRTISKTREEAFALVKKYCPINSFSDLVTEMKIGDYVIPNHWSQDFMRLLYNDMGYPGLDLFSAELSR